MMANTPDRTTFGYRWVVAAVEQGGVEELLLADNLFRANNVARREQYVTLAAAARARVGRVGPLGT